MKLLCETTGDFQLVDFGNKGHTIRAFRPTVTPNTPFVSARGAAGQIRVLGNVSDEATDEEFEKYVKDSEDMALAISAFLAAYPVEGSPEKPKPSTRRTK